MVKSSATIPKEERDDKVRVLRVIEYVGPRHWVEATLLDSIQGTKVLGKDRFISAATIGSFPEILEEDEFTGMIGKKHG